MMLIQGIQHDAQCMRAGGLTELPVNQDQGTLALALVHDFIGQELLEAFANFTLLQGGHLLHGGRSGSESVNCL